MTLEVCASSYGSVVAAYKGGAARVELCSGLSEGGLTPSAALIKHVVDEFRSSTFSVNVLIRPRRGNFHYVLEAEADIVADDIRMAADLGANGVVVGALTADGHIDVPLCRRWVELAHRHGMSVTFHRAFDECHDPVSCLEDVIACGADRLLTSGHAPTAPEGIETLRRLVKQADGRIIIMPGCGVTPDNAAQILHQTAACEIHASARNPLTNETDEDVVRQIIHNIN